jgi:error-prone DNA polymerase
MTAYAELQVTTNFSFLRGGSHPAELVETAIHLGLSAIAVTDRNSLAGIVRGHVAANRDEDRQPARRIPYIVGCRLDLTDAPSLLCYPTDRTAYGRLCRLLSLGKLRAKKGQCDLSLADLPPWLEGQILVALPPDRIDDGFADHLARLRAEAPKRLFLAAILCQGRGSAANSAVCYCSASPRSIRPRSICCSSASSPRSAQRAARHRRRFRA